MTDQDLETSLRPELDEALLALDELSLENPEEALSMFETLPEPVQALPEFQLTLARIHQMMGELEAAREITQGVLASGDAIADASTTADAHHLLGDLLEDLGDSEGANDHFIKVLEFDQKAFHQDCVIPEPELRDRLKRILEETIRGLPPEIQPRVAATRRSVSLFPSERDVRDGLDPRAMTRWSDSNGQAESFVLYGANVDAEFGDLTEFDEFAPHVVALIHEEIIERLELSPAESKRFGLSPTVSDE